jgi:hypothetical protein
MTVFLKCDALQSDRNLPNKWRRRVLRNANRLITRRHIPEESNLLSRRHDQLTSRVRI